MIPENPLCSLRRPYVSCCDHTHTRAGAERDAVHAVGETNTVSQEFAVDHGRFPSVGACAGMMCFSHAGTSSRPDLARPLFKAGRLRPGSRISATIVARAQTRGSCRCCHVDLRPVFLARSFLGRRYDRADVCRELAKRSCRCASRPAAGVAPDLDIPGAGGGAQKKSTDIVAQPRWGSRTTIAACVTINSG